MKKNIAIAVLMFLFLPAFAPLVPQVLLKALHVQHEASIYHNNSSTVSHHSHHSHHDSSHHGDIGNKGHIEASLSPDTFHHDGYNDHNVNINLVNYFEDYLHVELRVLKNRTTEFKSQQQKLFQHKNISPSFLVPTLESSKLNKSYTSKGSLRFNQREPIYLTTNRFLI